jgi:hypothetical protein
MIKYRTWAVPSAQTISVPQGDPQARWVMSWVSDLVAQVHGGGRLKRADEVELDVLSGKPIEEPSALAEQHRPQLDLDGVEHAGLEGLLGGVGAVHEDVTIAGGRLACSTQAAMPSVT